MTVIKARHDAYKRAVCIILAMIFMLALTACAKEDEIRLQGYVDADYVYLASTFSGILQQRLVNRGDQVAKGQLLYILDPEPQISQLQQFEHQLQTAQAQLADLRQPTGRSPDIAAIEAQINQAIAERNLAKDRVVRALDLFDDGFIDEDSLEEVQRNYKVAEEQLKQYQANLANERLASRIDQIKAQEAAVAAATAQLNEGKWALLQKTVYAPASGMIFDTYFEPGEMAPAGQGVLSLLPPENIYLVFFLPEPMLSQLSIGQVVQVDCDDCRHSYQARIYYISPQVEYAPPVVFSRESSAKYVYRVRATPDQPEKFHPGQPVYVTVALPREENDA